MPLRRLQVDIKSGVAERVDEEPGDVKRRRPRGVVQLPDVVEEGLTAGTDHEVVAKSHVGVVQESLVNLLEVEVVLREVGLAQETFDRSLLRTCALRPHEGASIRRDCILTRPTFSFRPLGRVKISKLGRVKIKLGRVKIFVRQNFEKSTVSE